LQSDYIDLYQAHRDDPDTPPDETLRAFDDLVRQGKVRYLGASSYSAWRLTRTLWESDRHGYASYVSVQPPYNLVNREVYERDLEPLCRELGIGVITYASLAGGFLSGKYRQGQDLPATPRAQSVRQRYMTDRGFAVLAQLERVVAARNATMAQVALAWILARPGITGPIASATSVAQVRELLGAVELTLTGDEMTALDKVSAWRSEL